MGTDNRSYVGDKRHLYSVLCFEDRGQFLGVLQTIGMRNKDSTLGGVLGQFAIFGSHRRHRRLTAAHLGYVDQMSLVIHVQNRLNSKCIPHKGRRRADATASLQIHQVIHGKPMANAQLQALGKGRGLFDGSALLFLFQSLI